MAQTYCYRIRGIEPAADPAWIAARPDVRRMFWRWVVEEGLAEKHAELDKGIDRHGEPLRELASTSKAVRRSESGEADPEAPPLQPGRHKSRTRALLSGRAFADHAEFHWRFDPVSGVRWGRILGHHRDKGRDVIGLSPGGIENVRLRCWRRWAKWKQEQARDAARERVDAAQTQAGPNRRRRPRQRRTARTTRQAPGGGGEAGGPVLAVRTATGPSGWVTRRAMVRVERPAKRAKPETKPGRRETIAQSAADWLMDFLEGWD